MADNQGTIHGEVHFDPDAFERRLERQQVIEFSDVEFLIQVVRDEHARADRAEAETKRLIIQDILKRERAERAEQAVTHFYRCRQCKPGEPCPEGWAYVVALKLGEPEK